MLGFYMDVNVRVIQARLPSELLRGLIAQVGMDTRQFVPHFWYDGWCVCTVTVAYDFIAQKLRSYVLGLIVYKIGRGLLHGCKC